MIDEEDLPADALVLEITEASMMSDVRRMERILEEFHRSGFHIAIDDFGTGYSSLSRLKALPVTMLKLDKSFLSGLPGHKEGFELVKTIVQMAQNLNLSLVAEGIENLEQVNLLQEMNCPLGQGFFFAMPMSAEDLKAFLRARESGAPASDVLRL